MISSPSPTKVTLVDMPWGLSSRPNAALGLLKPILESAGSSVRVLHANLMFADFLGFSRYDTIAQGVGWQFLGEWLFSKEAFPEAFPGDSIEEIAKSGRNFHDVVQLFADEGGAAFVAELRDERAASYCRAVAERALPADVVGFTCSISQLLPALAAARALRRLSPDVKILLGGSQVESEMGDEVLRIAPWVDAVYKGEGEVGLAATVDWLVGRAETPPEEFVSYRRADGTIACATGVALLRDMTAAPRPDYRPYFEQAERYRSRSRNRLIVHGISFTSSRGCWWGQKQHCTFCGLNGEGMIFRERPAAEVAEEIAALANEYKMVRLFATDNILPHGYLKSLLPTLASLDLDLELFYETKSNLKREHMQLLRSAGVRAIQPGIESLNDHVLTLMRKGVTGIQNVFLLKLAMESGVEPRWNLIYGFPGETDEDYAQQCAWIAHMHHLIPPMSVVRFALQRFSPFHTESEALGVTNKRAKRAYRSLFPDGTDLNKVAFYFDFDYIGDRPLSPATIAEYHRGVRVWTKRWAADGPPPALTYSLGGDFAEVRDTRARGRESVAHLSGAELGVFLACDEPVAIAQLERRFGGAATVAEVLASLEAVGWIIRDAKQALSLAVRQSRGGGVEMARTVSQRLRKEAEPEAANAVQSRGPSAPIADGVAR